MPREDADAVGATHPCLVVTGECWWLFYSGYDGTSDGRRADIVMALASCQYGLGVKGGAPGVGRAVNATVVASAAGIFILDYLVSFTGAEADSGRFGELARSEPSILVKQRGFTMVFVCDDGARATIDMATSRDGVSWDRRGSTLRVEPRDREVHRLRSPVAVHLRHRGLRLWYSARTADDEADGCRLWETDFVTAVAGSPSGDGTAWT